MLDKALSLLGFKSVGLRKIREVSGLSILGAVCLDRVSRGNLLFSVRCERTSASARGSRRAT